MLKKISSDIIRSIERSSRQVNKIPTLDHSKIKEKILESFIDGINRNKKIDNPS
ncbi:MAG: hypothetical protein JSV62_09005 [Promethearchaeota archaeon]|nr:MAG: hypothetical protein JSV62_09005 [Candidatus Lokiarchaeota archaeon]